MAINSNQAQYLTSLNKVLISEAMRQVGTPLQKLERMQELYLEKNKSLYSADRLEEIPKALAAFQHKYSLAYIHLAEIWTASMACRLELPELIRNSVELHHWDDEDILLGTLRLESFLFQARALLDLWMVYISLVMNVPSVGKMSTKKFRTALSQVQEEPLGSRAKLILTYFDSDVFSEKGWLTLLTNLRDKIAHRDQLFPRRDGTEEIVNVKLDWPTINKLSFDRFAQNFETKVFELLSTTSPLIFELEWKSGSYRVDLWD